MLFMELNTVQFIGQCRICFMDKSTAVRKSGPVKSGTTAESRVVRESTLNQARRSLILDAARSAFFELGLDGASLREIAKRAGYSPGAIYSYFANLEEIYGALLGESLQRLNPVVAAADVRSGSPAELLRAQALAFFAFYRDNPRDLDLGFYLFNGTRPRGLTPELNQQLNARLKSSLFPIQQALIALGQPEPTAIAETTAIFAQAVGLLILNQTGRIRLFRQDAQSLFERHVDGLLVRLA